MTYTTQNSDGNLSPKKSSWSIILTALAFIVVLVIAVAFRVPDLSLRPLHGDEANQAVKTGHLLEDGYYRYDPFEHHGPTLYYLTLPLLYGGGISTFEASTIVYYRAVPVFFGLLLILLLWPLRTALGNGALIWTALFMAISTPMVFYSRYYVQEMLLVCFVQGAFTTAWLYCRRPRLGWALLFGFFLGMVHATKETSIVVVFSACLSGALILLPVLMRDKFDLSKIKMVLQRPTILHILAAFIMAAFISVSFFSSFYTHARGPLDSILTYFDYYVRAKGEGSSGIHDKPWYYYFVLLSYVYRQVGPRWTEAPILAASILGALAAIFVKSPKNTADTEEKKAPFYFRRFLLFYTVSMVAVFSMIPYKTPWNLLPFYHGILLLGGLGIAETIRLVRYPLLRGIVILIALAGVLLVGRQCYFGNYVYFADTRNPYVYAHPSRAMEKLVDRVHDIAAISGKGKELHVNIIRTDGDYWPLPWYFRGYTRIGWWHAIPEQADADMILVAPELYESVQKHLKNEYFVEFQALRPGVLLYACIRQDLWDEFIAGRGG
ncbi:MAG: flippase activity-associated protein Agl23 [Candidatus Hydrogenedentales bacterium]|jgi:uncharacterized protein (TIGR03663 family)